MKSKASHTGFKFKTGWKPTTVKPVVLGDDWKTMEGRWQAEAFDKLKDERHMILNAPMGSGKSLLMCWLSAHKMKSDDQLRCIISVPQTIIASGFAEAKLVMPDGEKLHWIAQHDLCFEPPSEGTIAYVIKWLEGPYGFFGDRVLLCTHTTLVAVYKKLKETNQRQLLNNLLLWIDEAHHLKNAAVEGFDAVISNGIGELVAWVQGQPSIHNGLATASFFRGDRTTLLTAQMQEKYETYNLPCDKYLASMRYLRSFSYDFLLCGQDYSKAIGKLIKGKKGKDIIHIPSVLSRHSTGDKYEEVENIVKQYKKVHGGKIVESDNGLTSLVRKDGVFKICDLVDEDRRAEKKEYLGQIKGDKDALDAIIALGMFKEGANWIWADRSIIVGARGSLNEVFQILGRVLRDAEGKENVEVIQLLPFSLDQKNEKEFEENLNSYLKAIYSSLILENILHPVQIKLKGENKDKSGSSKDQRQDWLGTELPDAVKQQLLFEDVVKALVKIDGDVATLREKYIEVIPSILGKYDVTDHIEEISKQIWGQLARQTLRMDGLDVDDIDFDILQRTSPLDFLVRYTSGVSDIDTFEKLRAAIAKAATLPLGEAKRIVHPIGIKTLAEYYRLYDERKLPLGLPQSPHQVYGKDPEWKGAGDYLGTDNVDYAKRQWHSLEELKRQLKMCGYEFRTREDYKQFVKNNPTLNGKFIPSAPNHLYKNEGWLGWADFLGSKHHRNMAGKGIYSHWLPYEEAKKVVHAMKLSGQKEYQKKSKNNELPKGIPASPPYSYGEEFEGWTEWLGTGHRVYRDFERAKKYVHTLNLKSSTEWREYVQSGKLPKDIPHSPDTVYAEEFTTFADWCNYGKLSFQEAKKVVHKLALNNTIEYREFVKTTKNRHSDGLYYDPSKVYSEWAGWHDYLGEQSREDMNHDFLTFSEARRYVRSLKLKSDKEWKEYAKTKRPANIPSNPLIKYADEWKGMNDWLGVTS